MSLLAHPQVPEIKEPAESQALAGQRARGSTPAATIGRQFATGPIGTALRTYRGSPSACPAFPEGTDYREYDGAKERQSAPKNDGR